jgi:SulP family sulfate permease
MSKTPDNLHLTTRTTTLLFNRHELAGSLGDLGTLLPLAFALIMINGLNATAVFLCVGLFYVLSGLYFKITVPVQPMKVISAYAIAQVLSPTEITTAGLIMAVFLIILAISGSIAFIGRHVPHSCVRGVQFTTGTLLLAQGVRFILGQSSLQNISAEPFFSISSIGPVPIGIVIGIISVVLILLLLENRILPAGLIVIIFGIVVSLIMGDLEKLQGIELGINLPNILPYEFPTIESASFVLIALALPQTPMTVGNAIIAQADLSVEYFGEKAKRSSLRALALSMGLANIVCFFFGGMPLCHGAGGLAAHYRFGARTAGSNLMIGLIFLVLGLVLGKSAPILLGLLPFSVLGALLIFAGAQLAILIKDISKSQDLFVIVSMLGISLVTNLAVGFIIAIIIAYLFKYTSMKI